MVMVKQQASYDSKPRKMSLYVSEELAEQIKKTAKRKLVSRNLLVNQIVRDWLKEQEKISE